LSHADCTFRRARPGEEPRVEAMMRALDAEGAGIRPISEETLARTFAYLKKAGDRALCAVIEAPGGELGGYVMAFSYWSCEYGGELLLIDELYVAPEHRSRGVGAAFMAWIEQHAIETGHVATTLAVVANNPRAMTFYDRQGYERLGVTLFDKLLPGSPER
jgi:GNAT superfamily N-acetyltransferase